MNADGSENSQNPVPPAGSDGATAQPASPMASALMTTDDVCARIEDDLGAAESDWLTFRWGCAVHPMDWEGRRVLGLTTRGAERLLLSVDVLRRFDNAAAFVRGRVGTALAPGPRTQSRLDWLEFDESDAGILCEDLALSLLVTPTIRRRERLLWLSSILTPPELTREPLVLLLRRRPAGLPS